MPVYSSTVGGNRTLAGIKRPEARDFLLELANLGDDFNAGKRFMLKFVRVWPLPGKYMQPLIAENIDEKAGAKPVDEQINEMLIAHWILPLREAVRSVWTAPDLRTRQWGVLRILDQVSFQEDRSNAYAWPFWKFPGRVASLPPPTAFEQALRYLVRPDVRTGVCENKECPAPFYFPSRRGQRACSTECALPSQRAYKRRWWSEHGTEWRKRYKRNRSSRKRK
jgi:hypothetical protein